MEGFTSVKGSGASWEPKQTGSSKNNNLVKLEPTEKSFIIGEYVGSKTDVGSNNSTIHEIIVEKVGDQSHITGEIGDDKKVNVWGTGVLDKMIADNVRPGMIVCIKWLGVQQPKTQGAKAYHSWDVLVKDGVEGSSAPAQTAQPTSAPVAATNVNEADDDDLPF